MTKQTVDIIVSPLTFCLKGEFHVSANCHVSPTNSVVIKAIESTDAGKGNNAIEVTLWNYYCNHFLCVMNLLHGSLRAE